ncbi:hypothetical protein Bbelb_292590 [Branchiostoma belcheri]|nr:hypothetical protein Bbelb_292590 [Branchiostoma belcheri]
MSKRLHRHADCLRVLNKANPKLRKAILSSAPNDLLKSICDCSHNILEGNIHLTLTQKKAKQEEQVSPLVNTAVGLDAEMRSVLERPDLPDDEKATLYQQLLQRYLTYRDKRRTEPVTVRVLSSSTPTTKTTTDTDVKVTASPTTPTTSGKDEQNILDAFPKTMKSRARQILNVIKHKGGDVVPGSNVADLIRDALQMRRGFNPVGWRSFARGLASINAPEAAIRNPMRLSVIHRHKSRAARVKNLRTTTTSQHLSLHDVALLSGPPQARQKFSSRGQPRLPDGPSPKVRGSDIVNK